jgi:Rad3-related DNA helicase
MFSKGIGLDELEKADNDPSRIVDFHKKLNDLFDKQAAYMSLPHSEEVEYRKNSDALHEEMLNPDKTNEEHIKTANVIINLADKIRELSIDPLRKVNDEIKQTLVELDKEIKKVKGEQKKAKLVKWFDAINDYYLNRKILANYTISSVEWDRKIPESVIKNSGDITVKMSSDIAVEMAKSTAQVKEAGDKGEKLNEKRKKLANEVFGILE